MELKNIFKTIVVFLIVIYKYIMYYPFIGENFMYLLVLTIIIISFFLVLKEKYEVKTFFKIIILTIIGLLSFINTLSPNFIFPIIIGILYYKDDSNELLNIFVKSMIIGYLMTVGLYILGYLPAYNQIRFGDIRYSLGFTYPGFVGLFFIFICLGIFIKSKNEFRDILLLVPISALIDYLSQPRTSTYSFIILLVIVVLYKIKIPSKSIKKVVQYMFPILTLVTIIMVYLYNRFNLYFLDLLFSGRLTHYSVYINNGLLTNPFGSVKLDGYVIDNIYLYLFLDYGFIGYLIFLIFNHISIGRIPNDSKVLYVLVVIFIYGLADSNALVSNINFVLSLQVMYILKNKKGLNETRRIVNELC